MIPVDLLNYHLNNTVGRGSMGEVYLATHNVSHQQVAVKALFPQFSAVPLLKQRFQKEAVLINSLVHTNIARFINFVDNEYGAFIITEYVAGCTLEDFINNKNGLIVESKAVLMMDQVLDAFDYAHRRNVIHRAVSPRKIFLGADGVLKVLDFGIAEILNAVRRAVPGPPTTTDYIYQSPEQLRGERVDQRSDVYSLGVVLHHMLTGKAPYDTRALSEQQIKQQIATQPLPRMKQYYEFVSDAIQEVVDKATEKDPTLRYASCNEFKQAIHRAIQQPDDTVGGNSVTGTYPVDEPVTRIGSDDDVQLFSFDDPASKAKKKGPGLGIKMLIVFLVVLLVGGGGAAYYFTQPHYSYYRNYVEINGVPKGVGKLSSSEAAKRNTSYRFTTRMTKVTFVELVSGNDHTATHDPIFNIDGRYDKVLYEYADDGTVATKVCLGADGTILARYKYDAGGKAVTIAYLTDQYQSLITRHLYTYDAVGRLSRVEYSSTEYHDNALVPDSDGNCGLEYSYDASDRVIEVRYIGRDKKPHSDNYGVAAVTYSYDDKGNVTAIKKLDSSRRPAHDQYHVATYKFQNDAVGNYTTCTFADESDNPTTITPANVYGYNIDYNDHGFPVDVVYLGPDAKPAPAKDGVAKMHYDYNADGYIDKLTYQDSTGKPADNTLLGGCAIIKYVADERGNILSYAYYDSHQNAVEIAGIHTVKNQYGANGLLSKTEKFDKRMQPVK